MKKYLIVIAIILAVFAFSYVKQWYEENENLKAKQAQELLRLQGKVQEDSVTISSQVLAIEEKEIDAIKQSKKIKDLRKKYNSTLDSFIELRVKFDSLKTEQDTVFFDTTSGALKFDEPVGDGFFNVFGTVECPKFIRGLGIRQAIPFTFEVTVERLKGGVEYVSYVHTNAPFLSIDNKAVKVLDKSRWVDQLFFTGHLAVPMGVGAGLIYRNYGVSYIQTMDGPGVMFNYIKNIGELF